MSPIHRKRVLTWAVFGMTIVGLAALVSPRYRLMYNASDSAPRGWYALIPTRDISIDMLVFARAPSGAELMAAERGYLPRSVPLLKHVAATNGHHVCSVAGVVTIDGRIVARSLQRDGAGRSLTHWTQCRSLGDDEIFLLGSNGPTSFDSRYFGPVNVTAIVGQAIPLWTW